MAFQDVSDLGVGEFCHRIAQSDHDFPEAVVDNLRDNGISGSVFLQLSAEELKELAPRIADRVALRELQSTVRVFIFFLMQSGLYVLHLRSSVTIYM